MTIKLQNTQSEYRAALSHQGMIASIVELFLRLEIPSINPDLSDLNHYIEDMWNKLQKINNSFLVRHK
jgi:hypothetical protein